MDAEALERAYFGTERGPRATDDDGPRATDDDASTEFTYRGHRVVVRADGSVQVLDRVDR